LKGRQTVHVNKEKLKKRECANRWRCLEMQGSLTFESNKRVSRGPRSKRTTKELARLAKREARAAREATAQQAAEPAEEAELDPIQQIYDKLDNPSSVMLTKILDEQDTTAREEDNGLVSCFYDGLEKDVFIAFNPDKHTAKIDADCCYGDRGPLEHALLLGDHNYSSAIRGHNGDMYAVVQRDDMTVDLFAQKFVDEADRKAWTKAFAEQGYEVNLWVGGEKPLATVTPARTTVDVKYSKGIWQHVADTVVDMLKDLGYGVNAPSRPSYKFA
jgi:hypothetical protein